MSYLLLVATLILPASTAQAEEAGVVFAMGGERFVLTPACAHKAEHTTGDDGLVYIRFDMAETPACFGAFQRLLSSHSGERLSVTFQGEGQEEKEQKRASTFVLQKALTNIFILCRRVIPDFF